MYSVVSARLALLVMDANTNEILDLVVCRLY